MILGIRFLDNYCSTNTYTPVTQLTFSEGSTVTVNFVLVDLSKSTYTDPPGTIYIANPSPAPTLTLLVQNVNTALQLTKIPTQISGTPFWTTNFAVGEIQGGTYSILLTLTEGTTTTVGHVNAALLVLPLTSFPQGGGNNWFNGYDPSGC